MKIALYHNLPSGGARRAMVEMVKGLAEHGHTIDEYCPETADRSFFPLDGYVRSSQTLPVKLRGVWQRHVPLLTPYVTAVRLIRDLAVMDRHARATAQRIEAGGYDVAFTHDCQLVQNPDLLRYLATPSVNYCHHGARATLPLPPIVDTPIGLRRRLAEATYAIPKRSYPWLAARRAKDNIRHAGTVLTNSYFAREGLYRAYGVDSHVCYLGVDTDCFRPLGLTREPFVLSVGAIHYYKGYRFLIRALGHIADELRPPLVIAANSAEPEERRVITALAQQTGVQLKIVRVMDQEELVSLYNRAGAFVYTPIMEPWGLAVVEAMACGAPVVAVREGGLRESIIEGQNGLLVDRNEAALATALIQLLTTRSLSETLSRTCVEKARTKYTWNCCMQCVQHALQNGM